MELKDADRLKSDFLAVWYLRLNGVFTIPNFILHPDRGGPARTDADVAGVRFPFREEFSDPDFDDDWFRDRTMLTAVIAEVKTSTCKINGPWSNPDKENMQKIFRDLGWYEEEEVAAAAGLYKSGQYEGDDLFCSLFCIGNDVSPDVTKQFPNVPQRTWHHITNWIYDRFRRYHDPKNDHDQWDFIGKAIWQHYERSQNADEFERALRHRFLLPLLD